MLSGWPCSDNARSCLASSSMLSFLGVSPFLLHQPTILSTKPAPSILTESVPQHDEVQVDVRGVLGRAQKVGQILLAGSDEDPDSALGAELLQQRSDLAGDGREPQQLRAVARFESPLQLVDEERDLVHAMPARPQRRKQVEQEVPEILLVVGPGDEPVVGALQPPLESGADLRLDLGVDLFPFRARRVHLVPDGKDIGTVDLELVMSEAQKAALAGAAGARDVQMEPRLRIARGQRFRPVRRRDSLRALAVPVARRHIAQVHEMRVGSLPDFSEPVGEERPSHPGPG